METIKIKEIRQGCRPEKHGDWIDLKAGERVKYSKGDTFIIPLGVAMKLPHNYEAHVLPRSSTFKRYGIILANSMGIIDNAYCGNNDEWMFPAIALKDGEINVGDRIAQFRIVKNMEPITMKMVPMLSDKNRGGLGSTGI